MLVDTDVLVWLTRGHQGAASRLKQIGAWRISAITYMELAQGCRDKSELERVKKALGGGSAQIAIAPIKKSIAVRGSFFASPPSRSKSRRFRAQKPPQGKRRGPPDPRRASPATGLACESEAPAARSTC